MQAPPAAAAGDDDRDDDDVRDDDDDGDVDCSNHETLCDLSDDNCSPSLHVRVNQWYER